VILSGAVRLGADTNGRRKLHVQNLTPHPLDGSGYLFFSHEGQKLRPRQEKATRTLLRHAPHHRRAKPCSTSPAPQEPSQHALDHGPERAVPSGELLWIHAQELLEMLLDQSEKRRLARSPWPVDPTGDLYAQPPTGGRGTGR
jgi:hypothetical protein